MLLSLEKGFFKVCLLQKEEKNQEWDRQLGELRLLGADGESQLPHIWARDLWRTAGLQCQGVKVEVVHLSMAQGNAVCGSSVLQGVEGTPELKPPGRTKRFWCAPNQRAKCAIELRREHFFFIHG